MTGEIFYLAMIFAFIVCFVLIMRLLGAWMLRINDVINQLDKLIVIQSKALQKEVIVQLPEGQSNQTQQFYSDSNLISELQMNKIQVIEEIKNIRLSLDNVASKVSQSASSSTPTIKRMTMEEYNAKKAAEAKNS